MTARGNFTSHDSRVVSVFEIVGAYFTDTVFNHVFHSAKTNITGGSSLTDEFVRRIQAYVIGVKNDGRCYRDVVQGVHTYFTGTTRFTTLSFAEFVDRIVGVCVPEEYFRQFSPQDKDELLSSVLCDLVSNIAAFATKPDMLRRIIDGHTTTPEVTIRMLQDAAVNSLIAKRGELHNKFLQKMGQARESVSMDIVDNMKDKLRQLVKEKAVIAARAEADLGVVKKQLRDVKLREAKLLKLVELLRRGRDEGPAAVGAGLRIPSRDTIAETAVDDPLDVRPRLPPRRERIAERPDAPDDTERAPVRQVLAPAQQVLAPARQVLAPARQVLAPARQAAVSASFFKTGPADAGSVTAAHLRTAPSSATKTPSSATAAPSLAMTAPTSAAPTSAAPTSATTAPATAAPSSAAPPVVSRPAMLTALLDSEYDMTLYD